MVEINKFKIIVPCYNCEKWVEKCINSIKKQTHKRFKTIVINDASTDNTLNTIKSSIHNKKTRIKNNRVNLGALQNIVEGIDAISNNPEDIIVLVDGDDWLAHNNVFALLNKIYQDPNIWLTYGQYKYTTEKHRGICAHLTNTRKCRKRRWVTSHLRTFKRHLWDKVKNKDLRDNEGNYYSMSWDMAMMLPMVEMAGLKRIKYIKEILYIYNDMNPINDDKKNRNLQLAMEGEIRKKLMYDELP